MRNKNWSPLRCYNVSVPPPGCTLPHLLQTDGLLSLQLGQLTSRFNSLKPTWSSADTHWPGKQWRKLLSLKVSELLLSLFIYKTYTYKSDQMMWFPVVSNILPSRYEKLWVFISMGAWQEVFWGTEFAVCFIAGTTVHIKSVKYHRGWWIWGQAIHPGFSLPVIGPHVSLSGLFNEQLKCSRDRQLSPGRTSTGKVLHSPHAPSKAKKGCLFWPVLQWSHCLSNVMGCVFD